MPITSRCSERQLKPGLNHQGPQRQHTQALFGSPGQTLLPFIPLGHQSCDSRHCPNALLRRVHGAFLTFGSGLLLLLIVVRRCDSLMLGVAMGALSAVTLVLAMYAVRAVVQLLSIHSLLGAVSLWIREWHTHGRLHAHVTEHAGVAHRVDHLWVPEAVRTHLMVRHVLLRGGIRLLVAQAACVVMHQSAVE